MDQNQKPSEGDLKAGETRETTVEKTSPGMPEKEITEHTVEKGPQTEQIKHEGE